MLKFYKPRDKIMSISYRVRDSNQNDVDFDINVSASAKDAALKDDINLTIILEDIQKEVEFIMKIYICNFY
jgi:hypothetical protein